MKCSLHLMTCGVQSSEMQSGAEWDDRPRALPDFDSLPAIPEQASSSSPSEKPPDPRGEPLEATSSSLSRAPTMTDGSSGGTHALGPVQVLAVVRVLHVCVCWHQPSGWRVTGALYRIQGAGCLTDHVRSRSVLQIVIHHRLCITMFTGSAAGLACATGALSGHPNLVALPRRQQKPSPSAVPGESMGLHSVSSRKAHV